MIQATIKIKFPKRKILHRVIFFFRKKMYQVQLPETWEEVPDKKRRKILGVLMNNTKATEATTKVLLLRILLPIPMWVFYIIKPLDILEKLEPCVVWFLANPISIHLGLTVRGGWYRWRLPDPLAKNMTLGQYFNIEREWSRMSTGHNDITSLLSTILRPDSKAIDRCLETTGLLPQTTVPARLKLKSKLEKLPPEYVFYVIQYWEKQRKDLRAKYETFFSSGEGEKSDINWDSIAARIAETGVFGTVNQVLQIPAITYLSWANDKQEEAGKETQQSLQDLIRSNHNKFLS